MLDKDPSQYQWVTYAWVIGLSTIGGIVSFMRKIRAGNARPFNLIEFIGEVVTSGFVGVLTFYICEATNISPLITAAMVGVSGHMGSRALFILEKKLEKFYDGVSS